MSHVAAKITRWTRRVILAALLCAILSAIAWLLLSEKGQKICDHPRAFAQDVRLRMDAHPIAAPLDYIGAYVLASILALPV